MSANSLLFRSLLGSNKWVREPMPGPTLRRDKNHPEKKSAGLGLQRICIAAPPNTQEHLATNLGFSLVYFDPADPYHIFLNLWPERFDLPYRVLIVALARTLNYTRNHSSKEFNELLRKAKDVAKELCQRRPEIADEDLDILLGEKAEELMMNLDLGYVDLLLELSAAKADSDLFAKSRGESEWKFEEALEIAKEIARKARL